MSEPDLCEYEKERKKIIQDNEKRFRELGLVDGFAPFRSLTGRSDTPKSKSSVGQGTPESDGDYIPEADGDPADGEDGADLEEEATDQANEVHPFVETFVGTFCSFLLLLCGSKQPRNVSNAYECF